MPTIEMKCGACGAGAEGPGFVPLYRKWKDGERWRTQVMGWRCRNCGADGVEDENTGRVTWPAQEQQ